MKKKFKRSSASSSCRKTAKVLGTRVGTLSDWREASGKSGKMAAQRRNAFRDGR